MTTSAAVATTSARAQLADTADWPVVRLGEVLTKSDNWVNLDSLETYTEVSVRLWGRGVVARGQRIGSEIGGTRRLRVKSHQFIVSRIDARNGAVGLVPSELDGAVVSNDFPTFNTKPDRLLPEYLGWLSRTRDFVEQCKKVSEGTTNRVRLDEGRFLRIEIPLPPVDEQRRIVAKIQGLAAKLQAARRLRESVTRDVSALTMSLHFAAASSQRKSMSELVVLNEHREAVESHREYPQVGIRGFGGGLFAKSATRGSETTYKHFNRVRTGQLILSQVKGWEGAIAVCPEELDGYYASPEYRSFDCIAGQSAPEYLDVIVRADWFRQLLADATRGQGARRERTRPELFEQIEIPFPSFAVQERLLSLIWKLRQIPVLQQSADAELDALLPSILDKAFRAEF